MMVFKCVIFDTKNLAHIKMHATPARYLYIKAYLRMYEHEHIKKWDVYKIGYTK